MLTCRLGQACNHIAALLFFIDDHIGDDNLPAEISKISQPMKWNQPQKKEIAPARAQNIVFVWPSHTASNFLARSRWMKFNAFPKVSLTQDILCTEVFKRISSDHCWLTCKGLYLIQDFWLNRSDDKCVDGKVSRLWKHVIFWHERCLLTSFTSQSVLNVLTT